MLLASTLIVLKSVLVLRRNRDIFGFPRADVVSEAAVSRRQLFLELVRDHVKLKTKRAHVEHLLRVLRKIAGTFPQLRDFAGAQVFDVQSLGVLAGDLELHFIIRVLDLDLETLLLRRKVASAGEFDDCLLARCVVDDFARANRLNVRLTDDQVADRALRTLQAVDLFFLVSREQREDAQCRIIGGDCATVEFDLSGKVLFENITIALEEHRTNRRVVTYLLGNHAVSRRHQLVSLSQHRIERFAHSILEEDGSGGIVDCNLDQSLHRVRLLGRLFKHLIEQGKFSVLL